MDLPSAQFLIVQGSGSNQGDMYHYLIYFITVLIVVVVVVFILTKGNAFMYGFVMIILSPRGRLLHAVALRACFGDKS